MQRSFNRNAVRLSWRKKLLFAMATTAAFFLVLEGVLTLLGVTPVTVTGDPFVGFSSQIPLLAFDTDGAGQPIVRTSSGKLVWFNPQSFPAKKAAGTRRVFCVGGSTTFGRPFSDSTSYCGHLREFLPRVDPSAKWEVVNAGGVSYASYRVAAVMEELAEYEPDLFIVYSAHNEFLERRTYEGMFEQSPIRRDLSAVLRKTRTWSLVAKGVHSMRATQNASPERLPAEVDEILNHSIGPRDYHRDDAWHNKVLRHYELNLQRIISIARGTGAEIIFVAPASNLRDCAPFKSEASETVDQELELANSMLDQERFDLTLESCHKILNIDDRSAEAHFLFGRALFGLGRFAEAEQAFRRAIDEDVCPLRATTRIGQVVRRVARDHQAALVDFDQLLAEKSRRELGHGCVGGEYFLDHVHPTIDIHRELALWIISVMQRHNLARGGPPDEATIAQVRKRVEEKIDTEAQGIAFRNLAKVLHWSGKFREAAPRARDAIRLLHYDLESRFLLADCLKNMGRSEEALQEYEDLFAIGDYPRAYLPFGELLSERGELTAAKSYLLQAILTDNLEHRARAHFVLGLVHLSLGENAFAIESLRACDELYPGDVATQLWLAEAYLGAGDQSAALATLRRVTQLEPDNAKALDKIKALESNASP